MVPFRHARPAAIRSQRRRADRCLSALAWIALAVPCSVQCYPHRAASMLCGVENPLPRKPLTKPPHGQRGLTKARRSCEEVAAAGSRVLEPARGNHICRWPVAGGFCMPFVVRRGHRIHYTVEGEGPLIVLQHGMLMDASVWKQGGF